MPKVIQAAEFFVVGGPVQPDRLCYVEREADRRCADALKARRHCWVLGPRAIGKSSLMGRTARSLRQAGGLAALVDLAQLDARGQSSDASLWSYGIANKIAHELRIKVDLATWWREKTALSSERRLADFFWEIVLTNTTAPVTVFIDEIEQTIGLPFAPELFAALQDCDVRRDAEPDFRRLTFVLLGVASPRQLASDATFVDAEAVELGDFTAEESYRLALGFGGDQAQAQALMDRVCVWTNGHPYLTQKVARGVARKGGKLEDVERAVREQVLVPSALQDEPPIQHARSLLSARTPAARQARKVLRRVANGAKVVPPRDVGVLDVLRLSGVAGVDAAGALRYRNRIFKELLGARWLKTVTPTGFGTWAAAAALIAIAALGAYWYSQYLPLPYIHTLSDPRVDRPAIEDAYRRLRRLPGFAARAEQLLSGALREQSGTATTLEAALATDARLRQLPGQEARADALLADFWLRRAELAAHVEQRDAALLFAARAAAADKSGRAAPALLAELVGDDYRTLERTANLPAPPAYWNVDWPRRVLLSIDDSSHIVHRSLAATPADGAPVTITALQHRALSRELAVDDDGSAGAFELTIAVRHPARDELQFTLTAPGGARATVRASPAAANDAGDFVFTADEGSALGDLADENRRGIWRLSVVDRRNGNAGGLVGWKLLFGDDDGWRDAPDFPVEIPDPGRTEAVKVTAANGFALAAPAESSGVGTVALWNLVEGRLQDDLTFSAVPERVELNALATRLLAVAGDSVSLWNVADGMQVARLATQTEFVLPAAFSVDGGYVAIAERVEGAAPLFSLLSAIDGALLASVDGVDGAQSWLLGPGARYLALLGPQDRVRVLDPRRGVELMVLQHARDVRRIVPLPDGATLLTIDAAGDIRAFGLAPGSAAAGRVLGTTADAASASVSADGRRLAYTAPSGEVVLLDVATGALLHDLRLARASPAARTQLSPDGTSLVTGSGSRFRLWELGDVAPSSQADARAELGAVALDREGDVVVTGLRSGQLRLRTAADVDATLDYFGQRGAVTAVDVNAARGLAASGGEDGTVRVWDLASGAPLVAPLAHPAAAPVGVVALSADGRSVAGGAAGVAQVWGTADGAVGLEIAASGEVTALAFAPSGEVLALGDVTGAVRLASLAGGAARVAQADSPVRALAFAPGNDLLAAGDAAGNVRLWRVADAAAVGAPQRLPASVRWLGFDSTGALLYVVTDYWVHAFAVADGRLAFVRSALPALRFTAGASIGAVAPERVRLVGVDGRGALVSGAVDLAAATNGLEPVAGLPSRDWTSALGLRLDAAGETVANEQ